MTKRFTPVCIKAALVVVVSIGALFASDAAIGQQANAEASKSTSSNDDDWKPLFTEKMDGWQVYTGVPHKSVTVPDFGESTSEDCRSGKAVGLGDPMKIFSAKKVDGKMLLNVTGQVYAGISTRESFENYHLSLEYKWGQKKWAPRLNSKRDAGLLVHCTGKHGAFWNVWMRSLECQIQETDTGDFISLAGTGAKMKVVGSEKDSSKPTFDPEGVDVLVGQGCKAWGATRSANHEKKDDWNLVEVYAFRDQVAFVVNGNLVMHLTETRTGKPDDGQPLTSGRIQLQSEAAEVTYRDLKIRKITEMPTFD